MSKKPTMRDVAKKAGVSVATVSNILNNKKRCKPETEKKVMQAIDELNYYMNSTARNLSVGRSNLIGVVIPIFDRKKGGILQQNPAYNELIDGIEFGLRNYEEENYDIIIMGLDIHEENISKKLYSRNLDAVIFFGIHPENLYKEIEDIDIPVIMVDGPYLDSDNFYNIVIDDKKGGYIATKYLLDMGHREIAFVGSDIKTSEVDRNRYKGYCKALIEYGVEPKKQNIYKTYVSFEGGRWSANEILKEFDSTAAFITGDIAAMGFIKEMNEKNKKVPNDYSVVGFDNLKISGYMIPGLTTVDQDIFKKGKVTAKTMIDAINGVDLKNKQIEMPLELIKRDTVDKYKKT